MRHPKLVKWEKKLRNIFDEIDIFLEKKHGQLYPLHPSRAKEGTTGNQKADGLFRIGAAFSAGFGSEHGPGYIVKVEMITLSNVPEETLSQIEDEAARILEEKLPVVFPNSKLEVERDRGIYKIFGDLKLGDL